MAPRTETPRLKNINPEEFGKAVHQGVLDHLIRLAFDLGYEVREAGIGNLRHSAQDLAEYAVDGRGLDAPVEEYLITICPPVWMRAADPGSYQTSEFDEANVDALPPGWLGELILVMRAALARQKIGQGESVEPGDLAALASISSAQVRVLIRDKEIKGKDDEGGWKVAAKEAKRWLSSRGVAGFEGGTK